MRIKSLAISTLAAASLVLGACAAQDHAVDATAGGRTATATAGADGAAGTTGAGATGTAGAQMGMEAPGEAPSTGAGTTNTGYGTAGTATTQGATAETGATGTGAAQGGIGGTTAAGGQMGGQTGGQTGGAQAGHLGGTAGAGDRVAAAGAGNVQSFDCEDGTSFVATHDDPAYNGATSIAMQNTGTAVAAGMSDLQISLGEQSATMTVGGETIACRARN